jgi:hypothetical protein
LYQFLPVRLHPFATRHNRGQINWGCRFAEPATPFTAVVPSGWPTVSTCWYGDYSGDDGGRLDAPFITNGNRRQGWQWRMWHGQSGPLSCLQRRLTTKIWPRPRSSPEYRAGRCGCDLAPTKSIKNTLKILIFRRKRRPKGLTWLEKICSRLMR